MNMNTYLVTCLVYYLFAYTYYIIISHGLGNKATYLQMRRFIPCAILAVLPVATANVQLVDPLFTIPSLICLLWIVTYPTLYYLSNHTTSSDFEFHFEAVFGLYIIGWLSSIGVLSTYFGLPKLPTSILLSIIESALLLIPLAQIIYYFLYKACINENGMQMLQETHYNEIIEYTKSMPFLSFLVLTGVVFIISSCGYLNFNTLSNEITLSSYSLIINLIIFFFLTVYLWKKRKGVFIRTAIVEFYLDIKEYLETNKLYSTNQKERFKALKVTPLMDTFDKPSTIILVIGESASRDYMQAFNASYPYETTPWLSKLKQTANCIIFPHAYSSIGNTVRAVSYALTEMNQYNDKAFYKSCSIIDIAHKLGYKVHWYSNQGHLGCADTPVTLMADTADVAKWTKQKLNTVQYDESLLEYLDEVDPQKNNFVVIHLKGSHFNFINRYPKEFSKFGTAGKYELEPNYANTIAYTDYVLEKIYTYANEKLNLQSMIYFSDHATMPDRRRSPNFEGMASLRIPLFTYFSDEYINKNPKTIKNLQANRECYWTNDLAYELLCSIFNISSPNFDEENSLASERFKYKREDLLTDDRRMHIPEESI